MAGKPSGSTSGPLFFTRKVSVMSKPLNFNVVVWDGIGQRELGVDSDGKTHPRLADAELFDEDTAREVARKFNGTVVDAWSDDFGDE